MPRESLELSALWTIPQSSSRGLRKTSEHFSKISGLLANLHKTMVVPLGGNFSIEKVDQLCTELKLVWVNTFRLTVWTFIPS